MWRRVVIRLDELRNSHDPPCQPRWDQPRRDQIVIVVVIIISLAVLKAGELPCRCCCRFCEAFRRSFLLKVKRCSWKGTVYCASRDK